MAALSMLGASGMAAAWTRPLTAVALTSATVLKNPRRENIAILLSKAAVGQRHGRRAGPVAAILTAAIDDGLQLGLRQPERPVRLDRGALRADALARLDQQGEHVDLHAGELQLHLLGDDLAQGQDLALVVACDVVGRAVAAIGLARLRADVDGLRRQAVEGAVIGRAGLADAHLAAVEDRNLEGDVETALAERRRVRIMGAAV